MEGGAVFSGVIGERAPSFPDLYTGEPAACPLIFRGQASSANKPVEKTSPGDTDGRKCNPNRTLL